jgi:pilus assembly protein Flp/PilA
MVAAGSFQGIFPWGLTMFAAFRKQLVEFLKNEDGPTSVEYAIVLVLTVIILMPSIESLASRASSTFTNVSRSVGGTGS